MCSGISVIKYCRSFIFIHLSTRLESETTSTPKQVFMVSEQAPSGDRARLSPLRRSPPATRVSAVYSGNLLRRPWIVSQSFPEHLQSAIGDLPASTVSDRRPCIVQDPAVSDPLSIYLPDRALITISKT